MSEQTDIIDKMYSSKVSDLQMHDVREYLRISDAFKMLAPSVQHFLKNLVDTPHATE